MFFVDKFFSSETWAVILTGETYILTDAAIYFSFEFALEFVFLVFRVMLKSLETESGFLCPRCKRFVHVQVCCS